MFYLIGGFFLAPKLEVLFPEMPLLTIAILSSSVFSTFFAILYLSLRLKFIPKVMLNKDVFIFSLSGALAAWLVAFVSVIYAGSADIFLAKQIYSIKQPYFLPTLSLLVFFGPCLEEVLYRGYFFESLRREHGNLIALLFSSLLFASFHGIFGNFNFSLFFVFLYSVVFTFAYIGGGILSSIMAHSLLNFYLFYISIDF